MPLYLDVDHANIFCLHCDQILAKKSHLFVCPCKLMRATGQFRSVGICTRAHAWPHGRAIQIL